MRSKICNSPSKRVHPRSNRHAMLVVCGAVLSCLALPFSSHAIDREAEGLWAGVFAINIDPVEFPVIVNGGMYERTADKVLEPLHARCFVLKSGDDKLAICVVDSCMVPRQVLDQAKEKAAKSTGIPADRILISSTHTHSAPSSFGCLGSDADQRYIRFLIPQLAKGIKLANDRLQPAQVGWGIGQDRNNVFNRRWLMKEGAAATNRFSGKENDRAQMNPGVANTNKIRQLGTVDPDVFVLSFQTREGKDRKSVV